jgi:hypothetical protein
MVLIRNKEELDNMINEGQLSVLCKPQKSSGYNYYFVPNLALNVYNSKILISTPKYIVLEWDKFKCSSLLSMLRSFSQKLRNYVKRSYFVSDDLTVYDIHCEQELTFTIRCYLPQTRGKYHIESWYDGQLDSFKLPKKNLSLSCVNLEIRNIWISNDKMGYNIEVKSITI